MELYEHKLWDTSFHHIASNWKEGYHSAQIKLDKLKETV